MLVYILNFHKYYHLLIRKTKLASLRLEVELFQSKKLDPNRTHHHSSSSHFDLIKLRDARTQSDITKFAAELIKNGVYY